MSSSTGLPTRTIAIIASAIAVWAVIFWLPSKFYHLCAISSISVIMFLRFLEVLGWRIKTPGKMQRGGAQWQN